MRLIDADELKEIAHEMIQEDPEAFNGGYAYNAVTVDEIDEAPTIEAVPVVHSRWELIAWHKGIKVCKCLNCNKTQLGNTPLCGHCGADMRKGGA